MLSIVIPTRNREYYCASLISGLQKLMVSGVQVVIANCGDDPDLLFKELEALSLKLDQLPWLSYLPPDDSIHSMRQNWQRALEACDGQWVSFIGDDDFIDPRLVMTLNGLSRVKPDCEYFCWPKMRWSWPDNRKRVANVHLHFGSSLRPMDAKVMRHRAINFLLAPNGLDGFTPYHAATKKTLIEKVVKTDPRQTDRKEYFYHENVDYFPGILQSFLCDDAIFCERPFSLAGACVASNSAGVRDVEARKARRKRYAEELQLDPKAVRSTGLFSHDFPWFEAVVVDYLVDVLLRVGSLKSAADLPPAAGPGILKFWEASLGKITDKDTFELVKDYLTSVCKQRFPNIQGSFRPEFKVDLKKVDMTDPKILARGIIGNEKTPILRVPETFGDTKSCQEMYILLDQLLEIIPRVGMPQNLTDLR